MRLWTEKGRVIEVRSKRLPSLGCVSFHGLDCRRDPLVVQFFLRLIFLKCSFSSVFYVLAVLSDFIHSNNPFPADRRNQRLSSPFKYPFNDTASR